MSKTAELYERRAKCYEMIEAYKQEITRINQKLYEATANVGTSNTEFNEDTGVICFTDSYQAQQSGLMEKHLKRCGILKKAPRSNV